MAGTITEEAPSEAIGATAARGAVWQMAGFVCLTLSSYVMVTLLARGLGPAGYAVFGIAYSAMQTSELILRLGVPQALSKLIADRTDPAPRIEATGVTTAAAIYLAGFAAFFLGAPWLAAFFNVPDAAHLFRIAAIDLPFFGLYTILAHVLIGRRDFRRSAVGTCGYGLTKAVGAVLLLATGHLSLETAILVNVAASLVGLALQAGPAGARAFLPTFEAPAALLRLAAPIAIADIGTQLLLVADLWSLNALGGSIPAQVKGDYLAALSLARVPNLLAFVLISIMVPSIARALATDDRSAAQGLTRGAARFLLVLVLPGCALVAGSAGDILALLFGEAYRGGGRYLALLIFAQGLGFTFVSAFQGILIGAGGAAEGARRVFMALAVAIVLNLALVPTLGATGAGLAAVLALLAAALLVGHAVRGRIGAVAEPRVVALALAGAALVGAASWLAPGHGWLVLLELPLLFAAWLALAWLVRLIGRDDLALLRRKAA
ncbi:MAG: oligosaccharide flippase family protein [Geminicoccaceae bacterium]